MAEIIKQQDTRREFIDTVMELAQEDARIVLIVPDVGFNYIEEFQKRFPDRFFNFGVTEQSTMIIAAGLALSGFKPYVYSMINFVTFRPYEMVRNAVCLHNANVKIVGVKGSEKYKFLGFSHNLIAENEEIKALEHLPNLKTFVANTIEEVRKVILETYKMDLPCYIRI
jgi:transketolase